MSAYVCVCLSVPVDWLSLVLHMPFMVVYSDIRQGLFYSVLLCFWIIFAGEHMMVSSYSSNIVVIIVVVTATVTCFSYVSVAEIMVMMMC